MSSNFKNILVTGLPGVGKTTLIKKVWQNLESFAPVGFYTDEVREKGIRKGFELVSLTGERKLLSHVNIQSPHSMGKYRVDIPGFESFLETIPFFDPRAGFILLDEIGKMECLSLKFQELLLKIWDGDKLLLATIAQKGTHFIEEIKNRKDVDLLEIRESNRDSMVGEIKKRIITWFQLQRK